MDLRTVRGMKDILPEDAGRSQRLDSCFRRTAEACGVGGLPTRRCAPTAFFRGPTIASLKRTPPVEHRAAAQAAPHRLQPTRLASGRETAVG